MRSKGSRDGTVGEMTNGEAEQAPLPELTMIGPDDAMWGPPEELPPPLAHPAPDLLNTHEMGSVPFEKLVLAMARRLDGASDVHLYGRPGQAQHGLDVIAFFSDRGPTAYQAKHWQTFGATDLKETVDLYATGRQPFGGRRLVIAIASEVRDTAALEMLATLRGRYPELDIELWDRRFISDQLRSHSDLVTTFFGPATAAAFCTPTTAQRPAATNPSISADAVIRGPIAHLQLGDELRAAEGLTADHPGEAAEKFGHIADRVESSGFRPHAMLLRERQAAALGAAGQGAAEAWARIALGWQHLNVGDTGSAWVQVQKIAGQGDQASDDVIRCTNVLAAAIQLRRDFGASIDELAGIFDVLIDGDHHREDAALLLAEEAVAARRGDIVESRAAALCDIAATMPASETGQLVAARLRMCVADCTGGWDTLALTARETYSSKLTALILARHARSLAMIPSPGMAISRWQESVERACLEGLNDDAADWLYAIRSVRIEHHLLTGDINDLHRHALALRSAGSGTLLPEPYEARERALAELRDRKWVDAYESLHRYLWRSVVGADWAGEGDANELLGDLFAYTGRADAAVVHYIAAGERDKLEELAKGIPDVPLRIPISLLTARPYEQVAAFTFVAATADLITDEDAETWCTAAFSRLPGGDMGSRLLGPDPGLAAFKAFGQLAGVSTEDQAEQLLELSERLIPRQPNTYRFTDEPQVESLIGIARAHGQLAARAIDQLLDALLADQRMAEWVLTRGQDLLARDPAATVERVAEAARGGNRHAALAVIVSRGDPESIVELAEQELARATSPRTHIPGQMTFGTGLGTTAALVTCLSGDQREEFGRAMVSWAEDDEESPHNRYEALLALRAIARSLSDEATVELFEQVLPFAEGRRDVNIPTEVFPGAASPLQRYRVSLGETSLWPAGLQAAAALARRDSQAALVQEAAVTRMRDASELEINSIAAALASIPIHEMTLPIDLLSGHPSPWLRSLAAVAWIQRPGEPEATGLRLAQDPSMHVRTAVAVNLRSEERFAAVRAVLAGDPRRSIRQGVAALDMTDSG